MIMIININIIIKGIPAEENRMQTFQKKKNREVINTRSLSLELAKHQHRLASQTVSVCVCACDDLTLLIIF